jgi:Replication-relaxation
MSGNKTKPMILQPRDLSFFKILGTSARIVDREQAMQFAGFTAIRTINTRLLKLTANGFLRRYFLGTLKGGSKALYTLSPKGAEVAGIKNRPVVRAKESLLVGDPFVQHQLSLNAIHIAARYSDLTAFASSFQGWRDFTEPLCKAAPIVPDGYFSIQTPEGIRPVFVEVDQGTESLKVWAKKTSLYLQLAISGEFKQLFGHEQFRVLVVALSKRRLLSIRAAVKKQTAKIFWFSTFEEIKRAGFWSAIWLRPTGDQKHALLERTI